MKRLCPGSPGRTRIPLSAGSWLAPSTEPDNIKGVIDPVIGGTLPTEYPKGIVKSHVF
jgi:hypothetical protein